MKNHNLSEMLPFFDILDFFHATFIFDKSVFFILFDLEWCSKKILKYEAVNSSSSFFSWRAEQRLRQTGDSLRNKLTR